MTREFQAVLRPRDARAAPEDVASDRACGECTLCCRVLRVDELRKLGGTPCPELSSDPPGCGIHATRPSICRRYRCLWLQGGLEEDERPDALGAVVDLLTEGAVTYLAIREAEPGELARNPKLAAVAERFREALLVRVSDTARVEDPDAPYRLLLPGGEERLVEGEWTTVTRPGEPARRTRLPWIERSMRRVQVAWRRRKLARSR
ncbi:MAG: hypothetical protein QNK05_10610 [Myxococcota bacterium]|nr:hypothetical protein [Myxococcota bacterium]